MGGGVIDRLIMHDLDKAASEAQDHALESTGKWVDLATAQKDVIDGQEKIITAMRSSITSQEQIITSKSGCIELLKKYAHEKDVEVAALRDALVANGAPTWGPPTGDGHILEAK